MVSTAGLLVLGGMILLNSAIAAVVTRLLRVRLETTWGTAIYVTLVVPAVLLVATILLGLLGGPALGSRAAVVGLLVVVPATIGITFDLLWMPAPDEVELPAPAEEN